VTFGGLDRGRRRRLYGPQEGDLVRLGDTNLHAHVERSALPLGEEGIAGVGRNIRDGMVARPARSRDRGSALDVCLPSVLVIDPVLGVLRADIGIKDGRIAGIGHAGNPDVQDGIDMVMDTNTSVFPAYGLIATAGAIDSHVHLLAADLLPECLSLGYTTMIGAGSGLIFDMGTNPRRTLELMLDSFAGSPMNMALISRGASSAGPLEHSLEWGAAAFKVHEDMGAYPAVIDRTLAVADDHDVQVMIHTDSMNESVTLRETLDAIAGRTIHAYHVEGAGGGHAPDILEIVSEANVLPSSTNPTNPYAAAAASEHLDMIMAAHMLHPQIPEDLASAQGRIRPETMAAEDLLQDMGAVSMMSSDSLGMGRVGETIRRTWQLAHVSKERAGDGGAGGDNARILRYLAKYTLNPAIAHGIEEYVGSLQTGRFADIVLWRPAWFGCKPEAVFKDGFLAYANVGPMNGVTAFVEPVRPRRMFGSVGDAPRGIAHLFVSQAAADNRELTARHPSGRLLPVRGTRRLTKADMVHNDALPAVRVDPASGTVTIDGRPVTVEPAREVPLSRRHLLL
jgi:urease subunit alpha